MLYNVQNEKGKKTNKGRQITAHKSKD